MSHFRYANLRWTPQAPLGDVLFTLEGGFRRSTYFGSGGDGRPITGDIVAENIGGTTLNFGDGTITPTLQFLVTSYSVAEDWWIGTAVNPGTADPGIIHTYAIAGPVTASFAGCCRIGLLNNGANGSYSARTTVTPLDGNSSPQVGLLPVITLPRSHTATFTVPATDPNGDTLRYRVATPTESGITPSFPPNFAIDAGTGVVTWDNFGLNTVNFWTVQIIVEDGTGDPYGTFTVKTKTPVDFLLKINTNPPPACDLSGGDSLCIEPGQTLQFTFSGTGLNTPLVLNSSALPSGATMTPALPESGSSGVSSVFSWTPNSGQLGSYPILFTVTDSAGAQSQCALIITVAESCAYSYPVYPYPAACVPMQCPPPQGVYVKRGYSSLLQSDASKFATDFEKLINQVTVDLSAAPQTVPNKLKAQVAYGPQPGCLAWADSAPQEIACLATKSDSALVAAQQRADRDAHFKFFRRGKYLAWRFWVDAAEGNTEITGGEACFNKVSLSVRAPEQRMMH